MKKSIEFALFILIIVAAILLKIIIMAVTECDADGMLCFYGVAIVYVVWKEKQDKKESKEIN